MSLQAWDRTGSGNGIWEDRSNPLEVLLKGVKIMVTILKKYSRLTQYKGGPEKDKERYQMDKKVQCTHVAESGTTELS